MVLHRQFVADLWDHNHAFKHSGSNVSNIWKNRRPWKSSLWYLVGIPIDNRWSGLFHIVQALEEKERGFLRNIFIRKYSEESQDEKDVLVSYRYLDDIGNCILSIKWES
jgi:hypothetical protein